MTEKSWVIEPLCFGEFPQMEKSGFTYFRNQGVKLSAPAIAFLLRSGDETILVDTGPADPVDRHHSSHTLLRRTPEQSPATALRAAGIAPEELTTVVLTHLHYDHSYNLELFPNARLIVQAAELASAVDPVGPQQSMYEFGLAGLQAPWMSVTDRLEVVRGDVEVADGIRLLLLPGHTPGMQGVLVETEAGPHLLASDLVSLYDNIGDGSGDWIVPGIHTDVAACERSFERIRRLGATVVPSHDWRVFDRDRYPS